MPLLDIQRQSQQLGRIRLGKQVPSKNGKLRPAKLSTFRFTTGSRTAADEVAALYGGAVEQWERGQWEVITDHAQIGVVVPPRQVVSQWYEMWSGGGCQRRCDSRVEVLSSKPCMCPHDDEGNPDGLERARLSKLNPPQACKPTTRINLMLPDLMGLGVWRLDTHSYYAAVEMGDSATLMEAARERNVMLPAALRIDQRRRVKGGETTDYPVPVLEILVSWRDIVGGMLAQGGLAAQLPPAPGDQRLAITAGARQATPKARTAQEVADAARQATTEAAVVALKTAAGEALLLDDVVSVDGGETFAPLVDVLRNRWHDLAAAAKARPKPPQSPVAARAAAACSEAEPSTEDENFEGVFDAEVDYDDDPAWSGGG